MREPPMHGPSDDAAMAALGRALAASRAIVRRYDASLRVVAENETARQLANGAGGDGLLVPPLIEALGAALRGEPQRLEIEWRDSVGELRWHLVKLAADTDAEGRPCGVWLWGLDVTPVHRVTAQLAERERQFRTLAENSPDNIVRYDTALRTIYCNQLIEGRLGVVRERVIGRTPLEAAPPGTIGGERYEAALAHTIATGEPGAVEIQVPDPTSGDLRTHHIVFNAERDAAGAINGALAIGRDVTEQIRMRQALAAKEREFRSLAENGGDNIIRYDAQGRVLYVNPTLQRTIGDGWERLLGRRSDEVYADGRYAVIERALDEVLRTGVTAVVEQSVPTPTGGISHEVRLVREHDNAGVVTGAIAIGRDVTERVRLREALAAREAEFRALAENSPDAIARHDTEGRIRYVNAALARRLGRSAQELLGLTPSQAGAALDSYARVLTRVLATGVEAEVELAITLPNGQVRVDHIRFVAERDSRGQLCGVLSVGRDISDRKRAEDALRLREREFRALVESSPDFIVRYNDRGERIYINPALRALIDPGALPLNGKPAQRSTIVERERYDALLREVLADGRLRCAEFSYRTPDGEVRWLDMRVCAQTVDDGRVEAVFAIGRDITESVALRERTRALALSDPLTRLYNRQALYERGPVLLAEARRHGRRLAVIVLDVDRFKQVNDTLGHSVGDRLLCEVAQRIVGCTRRYDLLVRLGGDEFALLAANVDDELDAGAIAAKITGALAQPFAIDGRHVVVGASVGIAIFPNDGDDLEQLMAHADVAMYQAKRAGRGRFEFYRAQFSEQARQRLAIEAALRGAQHGDGLELHYQPQWRLESKELVGAEALLRWSHPQLGSVPPDRFIPIAEDADLIVPIGRWVLHRAAETAVRWNRGRSVPLRIAVNVSTRQFTHDDLLGLVQQTLARTGCLPEWLAIEVTEGLLLEDSMRVHNTIAALAALGITLSIDDFGTGYSSLTYLDRFDVHGLKLDRHFIAGIEGNARRRELLKACIAMARALRLELVAEGVETAEQSAFLLAQGCPLVQGYLFGRPVPAEAFEERWLARRPAALPAA